MMRLIYLDATANFALKIKDKRCRTEKSIYETHLQAPDWKRLLLGEWLSVWVAIDALQPPHAVC